MHLFAHFLLPFLLIGLINLEKIQCFHNDGYKPRQHCRLTNRLQCPKSVSPVDPRHPSFSRARISETSLDGGKGGAKVSTFLTEAAVRGPPMETKPNYDEIVGPLGRWMDTLFLTTFRRELAANAGFDSQRQADDYVGIIEIAHQMNIRYANRTEVQRRAQDVLVALFPSWMPPSYTELFSKPFPAFSSRMNAWATYVAGTWLMGECEVNDVVIDEELGTIGKDQGLLIKRCRFLEESGCASICVNSCKIPTQNFFIENMGLPLTMEPNYETFECQFSFGRLPDNDTEIAAKKAPCLSRCPTAGSLRKYHDAGDSTRLVSFPDMIKTQVDAQEVNGQQNEDYRNSCRLMGE